MYISVGLIQTITVPRNKIKMSVHVHLLLSLALSLVLYVYLCVLIVLCRSQKMEFVVSEHKSFRSLNLINVRLRTLTSVICINSTKQ